MINKIYQKIKKNGFFETFNEIVIKAINFIFFFKIYRCMILTMKTIDKNYLYNNIEYNYHFIEINKLLNYSKKELDMTYNFIKKAIEKNDYCYGIFKDDELISYGWYSNKTTEITDDLQIQFKSNYIYQYKGFTISEFRGKRLHAIGMAKALQSLSDSGVDGLLAIVESTNYNSRKSVYRMGYRDFGKIIVFKIGKQYRFIDLGQCKDYGFYINSCIN